MNTSQLMTTDTHFRNTGVRKSGSSSEQIDLHAASLQRELSGENAAHTKISVLDTPRLGTHLELLSR